MPNDPATFKQKVCGVWVFGTDNIKSPAIWAACARFVFCTNFKDGRGSKVPASNQNSFLVIIIDKGFHTQFFSMKLKEDSAWQIV